MKCMAHSSCEGNSVRYKFVANSLLYSVLVPKHNLVSLKRLAGSFGEGKMYIEIYCELIL